MRSVVVAGFLKTSTIPAVNGAGDAPTKPCAGPPCISKCFLMAITVLQLIVLATATRTAVAAPLKGAVTKPPDVDIGCADAGKSKSRRIPVVPVGLKIRRGD